MAASSSPRSRLGPRARTRTRSGGTSHGTLPIASRCAPATCSELACRSSRLDEAAEQLLAPSAWLLRPIHDLRAPARDKAKEAFFAAVAPTLTPTQAQAMEQVEPA